MDAFEPSPAPIGHNNPPADEVEPDQAVVDPDAMTDEEAAASAAAVAIFARLRPGNVDLKTRLSEINAKFLLVPLAIVDDEMQGRTVTFMKAITAAEAVLKGRRAEYKAPVTALAGIMDAHFNAIGDQLADIKRQLKERQTTFAVAKSEREAAERKKVADDLRRQADEAIAGKNVTGDDLVRSSLLEDAADREERKAATPSETSRTRGAAGGTGSLRTTWFWEVTKLDDVPREWLTVDKSKLDAAVCKADGLREIPGLRIFDKKQFVSGGR